MRQSLYTIAFSDRRDAATGAFLPPFGSWTLVDDDDGEQRELTYQATLSDADFEALRREWSLENGEPTLGAIADWGDGLPRHIDGGQTFYFEPMDWNVSGLTPVADARMWVSDPL